MEAVRFELNSPPVRVMCHGKPVLRLATKYGWLPGARYTNLRDIREYERIGLIDIDWKRYDYKRHIEVVDKVRPMLTIANDIVDYRQFDKVLREAEELGKYAQWIVIVPKDKKLGKNFTRTLPKQYLLGYSVPSIYGHTEIPIEWFRDRSVHLLGGRPDTQRKLAEVLRVFSFDGNRITLDAKYGDYFNGNKFLPHPRGVTHGAFYGIQLSLLRILLRFPCFTKCSAHTSLYRRSQLRCSPCSASVHGALP